MFKQEGAVACSWGRTAVLILLTTCLLLVSTTSFAAPGDCNSCHGTNVSASHHQSELYAQGLCSQCHVGVTTNGDCASCHTFVPQQNAHHDTLDATSGNCAQCHTNVGDLGDCLGCHQGSIRTPHHTAANDPGNPIDCASCHTTMEPLAGCVGCHGGNVQGTHHTAASTNGLSCQECHSSMPQVVDCESCHNPTDYWAGQTAQEIHHASTSAQTDCTTCHTNAPRPFNCHDCHQGEAADRHHALLGGTLTCANCHDAIDVDVKSSVSDCQDCHAPSEANQQSHHDMAIANPDMTCSSCHADAGDVPGCAACHDANYWGVDANSNQLTARDAHHAFNVNPGVDCNTCHSAMVFDNSCDSCHSSGDVSMQEHHGPKVPSNVSCGFCHGPAADIPAVNSCEFCHDSGFWTAAGGNTAMGQHHDVVLGTTVNDCQGCHDTLVPQTCATCHDNAFWTSAGRAGSAEAQHHDVVRLADAGLACADCHTGGLPGENNDCQACHSGEAATFHHETVAPTTNCQECHVDLPVVDSCQSCHSDTSWTADARTDHHATATAGADCAACHTSIDAKDDCFACHDANYWGVDANSNQLTARDAHHAFTVNPGVDCNTCHTAMVFDNSCDSCHSSGDVSMQEHHGPKVPSSVSCGFCHGPAADIPAVNSCEFCHDSGFWTAAGGNTAMGQHHDVVLGTTVNDCQGCHDTLVPQTCATCHDNTFWTSAGRAGSAEAQHHDVVRLADAGLACADCHTGGLPGENNDCQACHSGEAATFHHETVAPTTNCQECHTDLPVVANCESCHTPNSWPVDAVTTHHGSPTFAAGNCSQCHTSLPVVENCESCHTATSWVADAQTDHHDAAMNNSINCGTCHQSITTPSGNCRSCHGDDWTYIDAFGNTQAKTDPATNMPIDNLHHSTTSYSFGCLNCHSYAPDYTLAMPTDASCESCHSTQIAGKDGSSSMHHTTQAATTNNCGACHQGIENITPASLDCATCHSNQPGMNGSPTMHHNSPVATAPGAACSDCHTGIDPATLDCATCHASQTAVVGLNGTPAMHHATPGADTNCASCHENVVALDCAGCHIDPTDPTLTPIPERHHNSAFALASTSCADCHTSAATVAVNNCELCHSGTASEQAVRHHATPAYAAGDCASCHEGIDGVSGDALDCATCHATKAKTGDTAMHHGTTDGAPNYGVDNCATCHDVLDFNALVTSNECYNCHTGGDPALLGGRHHATAPAQADNCAACHSVDQAELDCATCHASQQVLDGKAPMHHATASAATCNNCHTGITQAELDCATCHASQTAVVGLDGTPAMHHATPGADTNCASCHENVVALDCAGCHIDPTDPTLTPIPERHHNSAFALASTSCADCHTSAATVAVNNCELCHSGTASEQAARHHATPAYAAGDCAGCHEGIDGVSGDALDCATCHATKAKTGDTAMHHGTTDGAPNYGVDNCATCHDVLDFNALVTSNECYNCHTGGDPALLGGRHHATAPAQADNCAACHSVDQAELDCATCHASQPVLDGKAPMHHATATGTTGACTDCHSTVDVTNVTCASCHASQPVLNGGLEMHHNTTLATTGDCTSCHSGADSALMDCASCHDDPNNPDPNEIATRHHLSPYAQSAACTDCHTAVNTAELNCGQCHAQQPAALSGTVSMHHDMTIAGTTGQCATCHSNATIVENDCSTCHAGGTTIADTHHATPTYQLGDCSACHVGAEAQGIVCASCHTAGNHHANSPAYAANNCNLCHASITLNGSNCEACHGGTAQTIPELHHATPLNNVGGDCSVCHQSVSSPDVCANCHSSVPHHNTMSADYGLCESCHTWPADKNENPQQASCRQCHGEYMHNKNSAAPIHDYRACFDCHGSGGSMGAYYPLAAVPSVFHARPSQGVGLTNPAPGKGTFNLFYSVIGGKSRSNYTDRFGDQEQWENHRDRDSFSSPGIDYNLVQISEGGQTYQVPAFDNIPAPDIPGGGTEPGGGAGLSSCTSCHGDYSSLVACDNPGWTNHVDLGRVDLATYQLAESTYLGSYCGGTEPPPTGGGNTVDPNGSYFEAESYSSFGNNFSERSESAASGGTYLLAETNSTSSTSGNSTEYQLNFTETGTYYIWFLGNSNGSSGDNSLWYGVDGSREGNANFPTSSGYNWTNDNYNSGPSPTRISINSTGTHTINIWARENGLRFDGFFLSKSSSASPSTGGSSDGGSSGGNLAEGKSASASDDEGSSYGASRAVDGSISTRWYTRSDRTEWLKVDLGSRIRISQVVIDWHEYYAREYDVEVSTDNRYWTRVYRNESGNGGTDTVNFSARDARYVRVECNRDHENGYSIYEFEVYQ